MKFGKQTGRENENKRQLDEWLWSVLKAGGEGALFPLYPYSMQSGCQGRLKRGWLGHSTVDSHHRIIIMEGSVRLF